MPHARLVPKTLLLLTLALFAIGVSLAAPRPARAGEFTIASCQANGEFSSAAF